MCTVPELVHTTLRTLHTDIRAPCPSSELMEVQHFRTIYHVFIAGLCVFIINTLAIDFIDEGR